MAYYNNYENPANSWKQQPSNQVGAAYQEYNNAPSYDNTNYADAAAITNNNPTYANTNTGELISTSTTSHYQHDQGNIVDHATHGNNNSNLQEEIIQEQVVPPTLDHLSRQELCQMIYRLDYERSTFKGQVENLRNMYERDRNPVMNDAANRGESGDNANSENGNHKRMRTNEDVAGINNANYANQNQSKSTAQHQQQQEQPSTSAYHNNQSSTTNNNNNNDSTNNNTPNTFNHSHQPTPLEIEKVQKRLSKNILHTIKSSAIHGGRKIPKSTCTEGNVSPSILHAIMQNYNQHQISDTKRMSKWNITNDRDIACILKCERLVHPVKHDGTGYIIPSGSTPSSMYNWAKFVGMEVRYDKRDLTLQIKVRTSAAGGGRPESVPEKVKYSRGEREDFPGVQFM